MLLCSFQTLAVGFGKHAVALTPELGEKIAKALFAFEVTFPFLNACIKLSVLMLYIRLFRKGFKFFLIGWWANLIWIVGLFIGYQVIIFTQCKPIRDFWDAKTQDVCRITYLPSVVMNSINVVSDLGLLILPMPVVWHLQMPIRQKVATCGIFALGSLVVIVSIVRIPVLKSGTTGSDASYAEVPGVIWSAAEPTVGLICACLPVTKPLFRHIFDRIPSHKHSKPKSWVKGHQWTNLRNGDDKRPISGTARSVTPTAQSGDSMGKMDDLGYMGYPMETMGYPKKAMGSDEEGRQERGTNWDKEKPLPKSPLSSEEL